MDELKPMLQNYIPRKALACHCLDVRVFSGTYQTTG